MLSRKIEYSQTDILKIDKFIFILILATAIFSACGSKNQSPPIPDEPNIPETIKPKNIRLPTVLEIDKYIYTDTTYSFPSGKTITIQNSFPKGGSITYEGEQYSDSSGRQYFFSAYWTRIINDTENPLEIDIHFPADSIHISSLSDAFFKFFLPPDILTYDRLPLYNYGLSNMKSYLDTHFNRSTGFQKSIPPGEEHIFYVAVLSYQSTGTPRAALLLKDQTLYYKMGLEPHIEETISCGRIVIKKNTKIR